MPQTLAITEHIPSLAAAEAQFRLSYQESSDFKSPPQRALFGIADSKSIESPLAGMALCPEIEHDPFFYW